MRYIAIRIIYYLLYFGILKKKQDLLVNWHDIFQFLSRFIN